MPKLKKYCLRAFNINLTKSAGLSLLFVKLILKSERKTKLKLKQKKAVPIMIILQSDHLVL